MSKASKTKEFWSSERCFITELKNDPSLPEVSVARTRVEPGVRTQLHSLTVLEWYLIESGEGLMQIGDSEPYRVGPGDSVRIPAQIAQRITNTGTSDLLFLCVCVPRFTPECYTSWE
ncbi:MAG TPA: cupin domain-containing protein [Woeseiaceae bacterium]|nr:cupin domain-containing protein [Woeseiaceae bacterium]